MYIKSPYVHAGMIKSYTIPVVNIGMISIREKYAENIIPAIEIAKIILSIFCTTDFLR